MLSAALRVTLQKEPLTKQVRKTQRKGVEVAQDSMYGVNSGRKPRTTGLGGGPRGDQGSRNGVRGQSLDGAPDTVLGDRQTLNSYLVIPKGPFPITGQRASRGGVGASGEQGRNTPRSDKCSGIRDVQTVPGWETLGAGKQIGRAHV